MSDIAQRIADSFQKQGLMATLGAELLLAQEGEVQIAMPFSKHLSQQQGFIHAGAVTSIVDSACGYAALTKAPAGCEVVTAEFKINLLKPALGVELLAEARVLRSGRTLSVSAADVFAIRGRTRRHVATLLATIAHLPEGPRPAEASPRG